MKQNRSFTAERLTIAAVALLGASCTGGSDVQRYKAVMHCPDGEPVALKGEFAFETKVPP